MGARTFKFYIPKENAVSFLKYLVENELSWKTPRELSQLYDGYLATSHK